MTEISPEELADRVKAWRGNISQRGAAEALGVPQRTLENIEQGRGFRYPQLLLLATKAVRLNSKK